ncbi:MAG TPA: hypothetical protein PKH93_08055 [Chitinophagales bacterium]|nr:hypothetical protein [Chitinophagales bacterium]
MKKMLLSLGILATLQVLAQNNAPTNPPPSLGAAPIVTYFDEGSPQFSPSTNSLLPAGCNRQGVIDDYTTNYLGTTVSTTELAWTGSTATCTPGTCSASAKFLPVAATGPRTHDSGPLRRLLKSQRYGTGAPTTGRD